ncbi:MAG TPA: cystathionine beta-lyase [Porphyromonadaceae bacterium]|jgi:cystathionine beta-lyase|nr:cystathionine beta-lyase [Porphyromonadaceae bacterium]HBX19334.1 cystathionine beta-lyase [Porphyromonadaceae bacterium]HCM22622.1 cystathionine beta-lyase [Porphyromonadaceae bacterium]
MKYNFDEFVDRSHTDTVKSGRLKQLFGREDLIPLWVADMDFLCPPAVTEALKERVEHGLFGYTMPSQAYYDSILGWLKRRHQWKVKQEYLTYVPGVVKAFAFAMDVFTQKGDGVIIQPPVYHPFRLVTQALGRKVIHNPLLLQDGRYRIDFDGLERLLKTTDCKMLLFCNPHNPGGRVWSPDELKKLAALCHAYRVLVVSDEIHGDMAFPGYRHTPFATVSPEAEQNSITLMAPSKTFNIAGIVSSFAVVPNPKIRQLYFDYLGARELNDGTVFAYTATRAAYEQGDEWLKEMMQYVEQNVSLVDGFFKEHIPQIKVMIPQASFLVWLDCRELGLTQKELVDLFVNKARLALNDGTMFGREGEGFMRMNVGTPRSVIETALNNLKKACKA